jgi:hypothetical protein
MDEETNEQGETQFIEAGRWPILFKGFEDGLSKESPPRIMDLCFQVEIELGLHYLLDSDFRLPRQPDRIMELLREVEAEHFGRIPLFVSRLERALAVSPSYWCRYVESCGLSAFDPGELGAAAGIARRYALGRSEHRRVVRIIHQCRASLLGQHPIPEIREHPRTGDPTLTVQIVQAVEQVQVNWRTLGLRPVVNRQLVVRRDENRGWVAWVELAETKTAKIHPHSVLQLFENGHFRLLRRPC